MTTGKRDKDGVSAMLAFAGFTPSSRFRAAAKAGAGPGTGGAGARGHGDRDGRSDSPCEATPVTDRSPSAPSQRPGDPERSIFVRLREGGYRLRDHTLFHLYVSTSPCGDARLNSPYEVTAERKTTSSPVTRPPPTRDAAPGCLCRPGGCARPRALGAGGVQDPVIVPPEPQPEPRSQSWVA